MTRDPGPRADGEHRRQNAAHASWHRRSGLPPGSAETGRPGLSRVPEPDHWDCHWPHWPPVDLPDLPPVIAAGGGGGGGLVLIAPAALGPPAFAAPPAVVGPATDRVLTGLADGEPPPAATPATPLGGPFPPPPSPPPVPTVAAPPAPSAAAPAPAAPDSAAAPVSAPKAVAAEQNPLRVGYPDYLQAAAPAEVVAIALTGAAGLAALAGAGGFVGYRQAKAGFALRAAGTARFLS